MKGPERIISTAFFKGYKIASVTCSSSSWPKLPGSSETSRPWLYLFYGFFETITFLKRTGDELWQVIPDSIFQGLQNRQRDLRLILLAKNFPRQIPWKWSIWGYPDLLGSPKTSDERVIQPVADAVFHAVQLPYHSSSPSYWPNKFWTTAVTFPGIGYLVTLQFPKIGDGRLRQYKITTGFHLLYSPRYGSCHTLTQNCFRLVLCW